MPSTLFARMPALFLLGNGNGGSRRRPRCKYGDVTTETYRSVSVSAPDPDGGFSMWRDRIDFVGFCLKQDEEKKTTNPVRTPVSGVNDLSVSCWWDCWRKGVFNSMDAFMIHVSGTGLYKIVVGKDLVIFRSVGMAKERQVSDGFRTWRLCRNCIRTCAFSIRLEMVSMIWIAHSTGVMVFSARFSKKKFQLRLRHFQWINTAVYYLSRFSTLVRINSRFFPRFVFKARKQDFRIRIAWDTRFYYE